MAITKSETFITSDGKKFNSESDALNHENGLALKSDIEEFCKYADIPLVVKGKNDKDRKNPAVKRITEVVSKWNEFLNTKV